MKKISEYTLNDSNPRFISQDKLERLKKSIQSFPKMMSVRPVVVDDNNVVLGGNMRFRALQELGYTEVQDTWIQKIDDLTEEQKQEFIIKDNVGFGEWDWDILANEWDSDQLGDWGLDVIAYHGDMDDINTIGDISMMETFSIKCEDKQQLEKLQEILGVASQKMSFDSFIKWLENE